MKNILKTLFRKSSIRTNNLTTNISLIMFSKMNMHKIKIHKMGRRMGKIFDNSKRGIYLKEISKGII